MFGWTVGHLPEIALGIALAWLAGMRAYLTLFGLGLAAWMGWTGLPGSLQFLSAPWVIGACALLAGIEFAIDKIPGLDGGWDLLQTFVRIPVGACAGAAMLSSDHRIGGAPLLAGAAIALCSHAIKTAGRRIINTSPEPLSNWCASLAEDLVCASALVALLVRPWLGLGVVVVGQLLIALSTAVSFRSKSHPGARRPLEATA